MDKEYFDMDGNPITLDLLCIKEPAWAANCIRQTENKIKQLEEQKSEQYSENWRRYEFEKKLETKIEQLKDAQKQVFIYLEKRYLTSSTMEEIETLYNSILENK
jgi:peroxiredoxin family protein